VSLPRRRLPPAGVPLRAGDIARALAASAAGEQAAARLAADVGAYLGVAHGRAVSSGRAALAVALMALAGSSRRRDVVIPAYTSYSVPAAVVRAGCRVRLCDMDPATLDFDAKHLRATVDDRTLAVVPNHLFGFPCDTDEVTAVARAHGAFVLEDAAQAIGARFRGRRVGALGDVAILSLGRGKPITALAGGLVLTDSPGVADAVDAIAPDGRAGGVPADLARAAAFAVGIRPWLYWLPERLPQLELGVSRFEPAFEIGPLGAFRAGLARAMLARLDQYGDARRAAARRYLERLAPGDGVQPVMPVAGAEPGYLRLPLLARDGAARDRLVARLGAEGLGAAIPHPGSLDDLAELRPYLAQGPGPLRGARAVAERLLTVPTHPFVSARDVERACAVIAETVGASRQPVHAVRLARGPSAT
jgi:dTDP-4-amino-4,6-dideoxygalactose transaminase